MRKPTIMTCMVGLLAIGGLVAALAQSQEPGELAAKMRGVFVPLSHVYIYSLDAKQFEDPANKDEILNSLRALAKNAAALEAHAGSLDPSFDYLRRSLAYDAGGALSRFEHGNYVGSRFLVGKLIENCLTCHSKLPTNKQFDLGSEFVSEKQVSRLDPASRVEIEIATRQFDTALNTYEELFRDPNTTFATLSLVSAFERYLRICIGVKVDTERPATALKHYNDRSDLTPPNRRLVTDWRTALGEVKLDVKPGAEMAAAKKLADKAQAKRRFPGDRSPLVEYIAEAALLHRYLQAQNGGGETAAEAFYMLAVAESNISRSYWISETDFLLEQAIRSAPKSEVARQAYAFLEEYTLAGHAVTAREMPENVQEHLDELRALIEN